MAIQLARAIGMQGGIPQSNLPQIIKEGGDSIIGALKEERLAKEAKAKKEQDLKDAIAASIDYTGIDAHPVDNESYRNDWNKGLAYIAMKSKEPNTTSSQVAELRRNFKQEMEDKKRKYESDWKEMGEAAKAQGKTHETQYFKDYVNVGTPDMEKRYSDFPTEEEYFAGNKTKTETIKGVPALVQLPWEERKKIDLKQKFEELAVPILPNTIDVAKSIPSFGKDLEYKNYVTTTSTKKGGLDYSIDEDKIKKDAEFFANEVAERKLTPYSDKFMQYQNSLTKLVGKKVASELPEDKLEAGGDILKNEVKSVAYRAFYDDAMREAKAQTIRLREEKEKGKGGMTFNFGQNETKNDTYIPEDSYDTSVPAESMYNNIEYFKQFERYKRENATQLSKQFNDYEGEEKEDEFYKRKFNEALDKESELQKGKTVKQNWIEIEKGKLKQYEGSKSISFNNKKEEAVALDVTRDNKSVQRQYIPSRLIYDNKGNIKAVEAYAAVQGADGNYVKKGDSVEIIPMTKRNFDSIRGNFPELLTWSKQNLGIDLKYSQGGAATKPQATKPAATETTEKKSDLKGKKYAGLDADGNPIFK